MECHLCKPHDDAGTGHIHTAPWVSIGMGRIGKEMASRPEVSICAILYYNRSRQEDIEKELGAEIHLFDPIC